jgi:hypothetical protein
MQSTNSQLKRSKIFLVAPKTHHKAQSFSWSTMTFPGSLPLKLKRKVFAIDAQTDRKM